MLSGKNIAAAVLLGVVAGQAHSQMIANGGFERGLASWKYVGAVEARADEGPSAGKMSAVFNWGDVVPDGVLTQSFQTVPGEKYKLEFDYAGFAANNEQKLRVTIAGVNLLVDSTVSDFGSNPPSYKTFMATFIADGSTATLKFEDVTDSANTYASDLEIDRVSVVNARDTSVGGGVRGVDSKTMIVRCANESTGQSVGGVGGPRYDCGAYGLESSSGDQVSVSITGVVK